MICTCELPNAKLKMGVEDQARKQASKAQAPVGEDQKIIGGAKRIQGFPSKKKKTRRGTRDGNTLMSTACQARRRRKVVTETKGHSCQPWRIDLGVRPPRKPAAAIRHAHVCWRTGSRLRRAANLLVTGGPTNKAVGVRAIIPSTSPSSARRRRQGSWGMGAR